MKKHLLHVAVFILSASLFSCGNKTYNLKCDATVPKDLAQAIEGHSYVEGDNPFLGGDDDQIIITIKNGKIAGFKQNIDGKAIPIVEDSQALPLNDKEDPQVRIKKCETEFIECNSTCGPAPLDPNTVNPKRDNCLKTCRGKRTICLLKAGSLAGSIGVIRT